MKQLILFISIFILSINLAFAQKVKTPLADKEVNVEIPASPGENYTWVKPHWRFEKTKYVWVPGEYIQSKEKHEWRDAYWERNQKTGLWVVNPGYWQRIDADLDFKGNSKAEPIKKSEKKSVFINLSAASL